MTLKLYTIFFFSPDLTEQHEIECLCLVRKAIWEVVNMFMCHKRNTFTKLTKASYPILWEWFHPFCFLLIIINKIGDYFRNLYWVGQSDINNSWANWLSLDVNAYIFPLNKTVTIFDEAKALGIGTFFLKRDHYFNSFALFSNQVMICWQKDGHCLHLILIYYRMCYTFLFICLYFPFLLANFHLSEHG